MAGTGMRKLHRCSSNYEVCSEYWGKSVVEKLAPLVREIDWSRIELKIGEFLSEFVGKMQFYLTALDRQVRQEDENPERHRRIRSRCMLRGYSSAVLNSLKPS